MSDPINPDYYKTNGFEVIQLTETLNFNRGNAVKYIARAGKKDAAKELEDLLKAEFYLKREIQRLEAIDLDAPRDPRVWQSICDVPDGVLVKDSVAPVCRWLGGPESRATQSALDVWAPFTEVIEGTE